MGHTSESFADDAFLRHLLGGITWALRHEAEGGSMTVTRSASTQRWSHDTRSTEPGPCGAGDWQAR
jgi:hypothetical protein